MNPIIAFLTNRYFLTALLAMAVMYGVQQCTRAGLAEGRASTAELTLATARRDLATCQTNTANLAAGADHQNKAISALGEQMATIEANASEAAQAGRKSATAAANTAAAVMAYRPQSDDLCAEAFKLGVVANGRD